jgi:uridine kinase
METGRAKFPIFDFATQAINLEAQDVTLGEGDVLIMEGIHAPNPNVLKHIGREHVFRMYCSVRTKFVSGDETVLVPKDFRLMRRMVRDYNSAIICLCTRCATGSMWWKARKINIDTYRDDVEMKLDNTIDYEVCVWREVLDGLLRSSALENNGEYPELTRIFEALTRFEQVDHLLIPKNSLLREFIGDDA